MRIGIILFRDDSASLIRSSRACLRVESESPIRETASLSGAMLKLLIVWWMSYMLLAIELRDEKKCHTDAGSSSSNILMMVDQIAWNIIRYSVASGLLSISVSRIGSFKVLLSLSRGDNPLNRIATKFGSEQNKPGYHQDD